MPVMMDLTGQQFGYLTALEYHSSHHEKVYWRCRCVCGKETMARSGDLRSGNTQSCGCRKGYRTHGHSHVSAYKIWEGMKRRCVNPSDPEYRNYGGRGIRVCDHWQSFENFYADMGDRPAGMSIDRIDSDGDYTPENCRWATPLEQSQNSRHCRYAVYAGQRLCLAEWARRLGVSRQTLQGRARRSSPDLAVAHMAWIALQEDV